MWPLIKKELKVQLASPILAVGMALFLFLTGMAFTAQLTNATPQNLPEASMRGMIYFMAVILLFISPFLTMRTFSEEFRNGTMELLKTCPLSDFQIVAAKYLSTLILLGLILLATLEYPIFILLTGDDPEWFPMILSYLGLFLLGSGFLAVGLFASVLTKNQVIAALVSFTILLSLWFLSDLGGDLGEALSPIMHIQSFSVGVLEALDLYYYLAFSGLFVFLTIRYLEMGRWK